MRLINLGDVLTDPWHAERGQDERDHRENVWRQRNLLDYWDDEDPIPEGPAPQVSGTVNRPYGGPGSQAPGRTAS
jgi:hypothetical protein